MSVTEDKLGNFRVTVLRDTGVVVVRKGLVDKCQYTGLEQTCMLSDGSKIKVPQAKLYVDTPYFIGEVEVWCMEHPMCDLIIGNIKGAREPNSPDSNLEISAVQTRQQVRNSQRPYQQLKVPEAVKEISPDDIRRDQRQDMTLTKVRKFVQEGKVIDGKCNSKVSFVERNGLFYREFQSPKVQSGKKFMQLIVPVNYRKVVLKLAH